jgi:PAS domain S-box-containing protein
MFGQPRPGEQGDGAGRHAASPAAWLAATALLAAGSYAAARYVGLGPRPGPWAYWPINGLLLAILYRRPYREWPALAGVAAVAQTLTIYLIRGDLAGGATPLAAVAEVVQAGLAAWTLRRLASPEGPLARPRDLAWFVVLPVCAVPLVATPVAALALAAGLDLPVWAAWPPLFAGNSLSMLLFAPLLLPLPAREGRSERAGEGVACLAVVLLVSAVVFGGGGRWVQYVALPYAMFPLLAWAAVRCGPRWTSVAVVVLTTVACWCTARGYGPFAHPSAPYGQGVLQLQAYLAFAAFTALLLSAQTEHRRLAFEELTIQNAIREAFVESSAAAIVLRDVEGRHVMVNRAAEVVYGVPRERLVGRGCDALPAEDRAVADANDRRVLERGEPLVFEETLRREGGDRILVVNRFPVRDHTGAVRYLGMLARDVTAERELAGRLQRAQRVEILGQLAAGLAHDLNNLLTVMLGNASLLRASPGVTRDDAEAAGEIAEAGTRAARLTGRLLTLGRTSAAPRSPVDVDGALRELEPLLQALARGSVDLTVRPGAPGARVLADVVEIEQVVLNLVSNARAAIAGEGRIEVETALEAHAELGMAAPAGAPAERWLRLRVRDTGAGMDEATQARLFEPFFTTRAETQGTGIGLYTTSVLVREMGGTIRVESRPGAGTTFEVLLPCTGAGTPSPPSPPA